MRLGKLKSNTKGKAAAHNHRLGTDDQPNIDKTRSHLNMIDKGDMVAKINALLPVKRRKDAVEAMEVLLSASPKFFGSFGKTPEQIATNPKFRKWARDSVDWVKATFGVANVVDYAVHMDQETPHIHVVFVPLIGGRLCAKDICGRNNLRNYQSSYAEVMKPHGLERGISAEITGRRHTSLKEGRRDIQRAARIKAVLPSMPVKNFFGVYEADAVDKLIIFAKQAAQEIAYLRKARAARLERTVKSTETKELMGGRANQNEESQTQ